MGKRIESVFRAFYFLKAKALIINYENRVRGTAIGKEMVEYATSGIDENLFISKYLLKLPSKDEMERWLYKELKELR